MVDLPESLETTLAANPGKNYCVDCLALAAGFTLAEQSVALAKLMGTGYRKASDRVVEKGVCDMCGRTAQTVRLRR
jgi:hypothetical protein